MKENIGVVYILTNPSFPEYVKIGYADDVDKRLRELNRSECIPFAFRLYAYYKVMNRLSDITIHDMIDKLNPNLRSIETFEGKKRVREFYNMSAADALSLLQAIAKISGTEENITIVEPTAKENKDEDIANEIRVKKTVKTMPKFKWMIEQGLLNIGDEIIVLGHEKEVAKVVDEGHVNYKGDIMSFNVFGCKVTGWKAIQSYAWMKPVVGSKTFAELREEKMKELGMI